MGKLSPQLALTAFTAVVAPKPLSSHNTKCPELS